MRRRRRVERRPSHERWLVSYADFITLLFAFFVVMYSAAQLDKRRAGKLATAIQTAFQQYGSLPPMPAEVGGLAAKGDPRDSPLGIAKTNSSSFAVTCKKRWRKNSRREMSRSEVRPKGWSSACAKSVSSTAVQQKSAPVRKLLSSDWPKCSARHQVISASRGTRITSRSTMRGSPQTGTSPQHEQPRQSDFWSQTMALTHGDLPRRDTPSIALSQTTVPPWGAHSTGEWTSWSHEGLRCISLLPCHPLLLAVRHSHLHRVA